MAASRQPVARISKADQVYVELRRQLLQGERPYGQTFSTAEVAAEFGVSRRPVMDAVARLQTAGFIEIESQVGCRVVVPTPQDLRDHIEVSIALHSYSVRLATERATVADHQAMEVAYQRVQVAVAARDLETYDGLNIDFHDTVVRASGNTRLESMIAQAWDTSRFFASQRSPEELAGLQVEHRTLLDAVIARDAGTAQRVIELHQAHALNRAGLLGSETHV